MPVSSKEFLDIQVTAEEGGRGWRKDKKGKIVIYGELPLEGGVEIFYTLCLYVYIVFFI